LVENRHGLIVDCRLTQATGKAEPEAVGKLLCRERQRQGHGTPEGGGHLHSHLRGLQLETLEQAAGGATASHGNGGKMREETTGKTGLGAEVSSPAPFSTLGRSPGLRLGVDCQGPARSARLGSRSLGARASGTTGNRGSRGAGDERCLQGIGQSWVEAG